MFVCVTLPPASYALTATPNSRHKLPLTLARVAVDCVGGNWYCVWDEEAVRTENGMAIEKETQQSSASTVIRG